MKIRNIQIKTGRRATFAALSLLGTSLAVHAQSNDSLQRRIDELDRQIRAVARQNEIAQEEAKAEAAKRGRILVDEKGVGISSADGAFSLRNRGFIQTSGTRFFGNGAVQTSAAPPE
jgi:hypothetical protein